MPTNLFHSLILACRQAESGKWASGRRTFGYARSAQDHIFQLQRVLGGITCLIIIEIDIDRLQPDGPLFNAPRPCPQLRVAVTALIFSRIRAVEANVGEVGG